VRNSVPFNAEADSLNCAILGPDVSPDSEEFELFIKEVAREMTTKAGQKCTAIRRAIVPARHIDAVATRLRDRLRKVVVGDPSVEGVRMGALASHDQQRDVGERVRSCCTAATSCSAPATASPRGEAWPKARSSPRPCCWPATRTPRAAPTISKRSARSAR
jgi:oxepin-CoA hydrolase/3-oxo-5,6-dehydrosuberyl-CoA semialdehyde dehydrogenase